MAIFDPTASCNSPDGEFFLHATTLKQALLMVQKDADGLKPIGDGQLGLGFYVCGVKSDYQKGMARRSIEEADHPLFLFYVYVADFYRLTPIFLTKGWDIKEASADCDFVAVSWHEYGQGAVGSVEKAGFVPPLTMADRGTKREFVYGQVQGEQIAPVVPKEVRPKFMDSLWKHAVNKSVPSRAADHVRKYGPAGLQTIAIGARTNFKRSLLELAFKSPKSLAHANIVGVKIFSPTLAPVALDFEYKRKRYSLLAAKQAYGNQPAGAAEDPMNFYDEVWIDLGLMLQALK